MKQGAAETITSVMGQYVHGLKYNDMTACGKRTHSLIRCAQKLLSVSHFYAGTRGFEKKRWASNSQLVSQFHFLSCRRLFQHCWQILALYSRPDRQSSLCRNRVCACPPSLSFPFHCRCKSQVVTVHRCS